MITAIDSSVLLDVFLANNVHLARSQELLRKAIREGRLILGEVVLAELRPAFKQAKQLDDALARLGVDYLSTPREASLLAGEIFQKYRSTGGKREHLIPDFLVAAHALVSADRLLTRDRGFYRKWFRGLRLLEP